MSEKIENPLDYVIESEAKLICKTHRIGFHYGKNLSHTAKEIREMLQYIPESAIAIMVDDGCDSDLIPDDICIVRFLETKEETKGGTK